MIIENIPIGKEPPWDISVIIEVPFGREPVKYEMDKKSGALYVDRVMHKSMRIPAITDLSRTHCQKMETL